MKVTKDKEKGELYGSKGINLQTIERNDFSQEYFRENLQSLGFTARFLVQANLPHRDPGEGCKIWIKHNGNFCLCIKPLILPGYSKEINLGFPYGNLPRLILIYLCSEAVKTQCPIVDLGSSMSWFMKNLGLAVSGGKKGEVARFKNQLKRLLTSKILFNYQGNFAIAESEIYKGTPLAQRSVLWWHDESSTGSRDLLSSFVELSPDIFKEIIEHPVPVDLEVISALRRSSLALDLYCWLTHRVSYLNKPIRVPWILLAQQLGGNYATIKDFKKYAKQALKKVRLMWPQLKIEEVVGGFMIYPCSPHVKKI